MGLEGYFDREYISSRASKLYGMKNIASKYDYAFRNILDIHNGKNGWYSPISYLQTLTNVDKKINWYYFYTPDYEIWHTYLFKTLSKYIKTTTNSS